MYRLRNASGHTSRKTKAYPNVLQPQDPDIAEVSTISGWSLLSSSILDHSDALWPTHNIRLCFLIKANEDVAPSVMGGFKVVNQTAEEGMAWADYNTGIQ